MLGAREGKVGCVSVVNQVTLERAGCRQDDPAGRREEDSVVGVQLTEGMEILRWREEMRSCPPNAKWPLILSSRERMKKVQPQPQAGWGFGGEGMLETSSFCFCFPSDARSETGVSVI